MCGIAGVFTLNGDQSGPVLEAMCDRMVHRGPDDAGVYVRGGNGIGMRRLSIIDLATGHQPLSNEDESVWIVLNGEIYNYRELRLELESKGHLFRTNTDTETVVHLYEEEGIEGIPRLRGMFAFAIWDAKAKELVLARDRFGKKPLYYSAQPHGFYFASELDALRAAPIPAEIDRAALRWYFLFSWIPDPLTAYADVRKLEPGCWLRRGQEGSIQTGRYWRLPDPGPLSADPEPPPVVLDELRKRFDEAVRVRLVADVPLGAFLSGGIDSSSVVASMARQTGAPVKTFSIGFEDPVFNELEYASLVAAAYRTEHHEIVVRPDAINLVTKLARHFGEPFGDPSAIPTFIVSEFAASRVKVALSGDGGDELFAGYDSFQLVQKDRAFDYLPAGVRRAIGATAARMPYWCWGKNFLRMVSRPTPLERYFEHTYAPHLMLERILEPSWIPPSDAASLIKAFPDCFLPGSADVLAQAIYFEATAKLAGDMLTKVDRMSMAASLEVRCPFLDHELAEFAQSLPVEWKMGEGRGKRILLGALGPRLPAALLSRSKMGFGVPIAVWFRGPLKGFVRDHLTAAEFRNRQVASPEFVGRLLDEHESGRRDNGLWLWQLLMLELWFRDVAARNV
jgi:asparagine synthase (glutamine-hydrolysing)